MKIIEFINKIGRCVDDIYVDENCEVEFITPEGIVIEVENVSVGDCKVVIRLSDK